MTTTTTDTQLSQLIINELTEAEYAALTPEANQIYFTPDTAVYSVNNETPDANGNVSLTIPTVNDATLTITQGGTTKGTFTANASSNTTIALDAGNTYTAGTGLKLSNNDTEFNIMQQDINAEAVNVVGTLTENNNVWSGFSNNNYLTLLQNLSLSATDEWEIQFKFLQNSIDTNNRYIMLSDKLYIYVFNGYVYVYYPLTGVNPQYAQSAMDTQAHYRWVKVKRELGSGTFTTVSSISTDGTNWTTFKNLSTTGTPYAFTSGVKLGAGSTAQQAFNGSIDLNECYIKINGTTWWSGQGQTAKSVAKATTSLYGLVKPDGNTISVSNGVISGFSGNYNDLSNKPTIPTVVSSVSSSSTNADAVGAKLFYDTCGDIEATLQTIRGV